MAVDWESQVSPSSLGQEMSSPPTLFSTSESCSGVLQSIFWKTAFEFNS